MRRRRSRKWSSPSLFAYFSSPFSLSFHPNLSSRHPLPHLSSSHHQKKGGRAAKLARMIPGTDRKKANTFDFFRQMNAPEKEKSRIAKSDDEENMVHFSLHHSSIRSVFLFVNYPSPIPPFFLTSNPLPSHLSHLFMDEPFFLLIFPVCREV